MADITVSKINEALVRVECAEESTKRELEDYFTFEEPGAKYSPHYRAKHWDGKTRLLSKRGTLPSGLVLYVKAFAKDNNYTVEVDPQLESLNNFSLHEAEEYIKSLTLTKTPRDYQILGFTKAVRYKRVVLVSPTACHAANDEVLMGDFTYKKIQDIKVGDFVCGADGCRKRVLRTFQGEDNLYDICPRTSRKSIRVTGNHILHLVYNGAGKNSNQIENISVEDYIKTAEWHKHITYLKYNDIPLIGESKKIECNITPYFIGLYLGDGTCGSASITTDDREIVEEAEKVAQQLGLSVRYDGRLCYHLTRGRNIWSDGKISRNPLFAEFDKIGLHFGQAVDAIKCDTKFIPDNLFNISIQDRYELLAGLLDSDGWCAGRYFEFCSKSKILALGVERLALSLGLIAHTRISHNKKYDRDYWSTIIMGNTHLIPTRLKRKQVENTQRQRNPYRTNFTVESVGLGKYYGIQVEDSLYITHSGMVTHNSGKSLCLYLISRYLLEHPSATNCKRGLIIVPNINLVEQLYSDFIEYGGPPKAYQKIYQGHTKTIDRPITISTWQSIYDLGDKEFFEQFDFVIGDEAHTFKAHSLKTIMGNLSNAKYRIGTTGTLDDFKIHRLKIEGHFGPVSHITTTKALMEAGHVSDLSIKAIILGHPEHARQDKLDYQSEMDYLCRCKKRNDFIKNLALSLKGNTLILVQYIEKHGDVLFEAISKSVAAGRQVFYVHGGTDGEQRESIRRIVELEKDAIIVASYGVYAVGVNIRNLHNIIFASPSKSKVRVLQSIGRGLRLGDDKTIAILYDISDDLRCGKYINHTLRHYLERMKIYDQEGFKVTKYQLGLQYDNEHNH